MTKKFIIRSIAATVVSFAAKLVVKKLQEKKKKSTDMDQDPETPGTNVYPPQQGTAI